MPEMRRELIPDFHELGDVAERVREDEGGGASAAARLAVEDLDAARRQLFGGGPQVACLEDEGVEGACARVVARGPRHAGPVVEHEGERFIRVTEGQVERQVLLAADDEAELVAVEVSGRPHVRDEEAEVVEPGLLERLDLDDCLVHQRDAPAERVFDEDGVAHGLPAPLLLAELDAERLHPLDCLAQVVDLQRERELRVFGAGRAEPPHAVEYQSLAAAGFQGHVIGEAAAVFRLEAELALVEREGLLHVVHVDLDAVGAYEWLRLGPADAEVVDEADRPDEQQEDGH